MHALRAASASGKKPSLIAMSISSCLDIWPGRKQIIEMLWEIAMADPAAHEFESNLVWRVAELLGVSAAIACCCGRRWQVVLA